MSATVEGVFRIVDRASPKMRDMQIQAVKTDLAIEALGHRLDTLGSNKQLKSLDNLERRLKTVGQDAQNTVTRIDNVTKSLDKQTTSTRKNDSMWRRMTGTFGLFFKDLLRLKVPLMFTGIGAAVGVLGQAIGALGGGVVGLASELGSLSAPVAAGIAGITGFGLAAVTGKLAISNLSQAMAGNARAMRSLTPEGHKLAASLRQFRPVFREFKRSAQDGLFKGLLSDLGDLRRASPVVNSVLANMSKVEGSLAAKAGKQLTSRGFLKDFQSVAGQGTNIVGAAGQGVLNIVDALRHVAVAAEPFTTWLTKVALGWTSYIDKAAKAGRASGKLATFFERAKTRLKLFFDIIKNVAKGFSELMRAARPLGDLMLRDADHATKMWATMLGGQREQLSLTQRFIGMEPAIKAIFGFVGEIGRVLFRMGSDNRLATTVNTLSKALPPIGAALSRIANTFGPKLASALTAVAKLVSDLSSGASPLVTVVNAIGGIAGFLDRIVKAAPAVQGLFAAIFSTFVISRYAVKLGLLEKGWWNVAAAARAAAGAEALATGVGAGGVVGGLGRAGGSVGGPVILGPTGRRVGGLFRSLFGRGQVVEGPLTEAQAAAGASGLVAGRGLLLPKLGFAAAGGGLLARLGGLGGAARLGIGALGKVALPIAAIQSIFGALSAGRSGSFGHQAAQTLFGAVNPLTFGFLGKIGGLGGLLETPAQRAQQAVSRTDARTQQQLSAANRIPGVMSRLEAQLRILDAAAGSISDRQAQASKDYIAQLQNQTQAIRDQIAAMKAQQRAQGTQAGQSFLSQLDKLGAQRIRAHGLVKGFTATDTTGLEGINAASGPGAAAGAKRLKIARGLIKNVFNEAKIDPRLRPEAARLEAAIPAILNAANAAVGVKSNIQVSGPRVLTGSLFERRAISQQLGTDPVQKSMWAQWKGPTPLQQRLIASIVAAGYDPTAAGALVMGMERDSTGRTYANWSGDLGPGTRKARGGRIAGRGLSDTVPVPGGMAAPGELVVNRHTERRVDALLGSRTLGQMVQGENHPHSADWQAGGSWRHATGGRIVSPVAQGTKVGRVDQGVDFNQPGPYVAVAPGRVSAIGGGWAGGTGQGTSINLDRPVVAGGHTYQQVYYAEERPLVRLRQHVKAGQPVMGGGGAEIGFLVNGRPAKLVGGLGAGTQPTRAGADFLSLITGGSVFSAVGALVTGAANAAQSKAAGGPMSFTLASAISDDFAFLDSLTGLPGFSTAPTRPTTSAKAAPAVSAKTKGRARAVSGFAASLARRLRLFPSVVDAWALAEGGPADNPLNIGPGAHFPDPVAATVRFLTTGDLAGFYRGILGAKSAAAEIRAIKASPFDAAHYANGVLDRTAAEFGIHLARGGRVPRFAGWHARGMQGTFDTPTLIGVGEKGREHVQVTPTGKAGSRAGVTIHNEFNINGGEPGQVRREIEAALHSFVTQLQHEDVPG